MERDLDTLLADTLFNANLRPSTKKAVLLASLKGLDINPSNFQKALEKESCRPENVEDDQRKRDRNPVDEELGLKDKELRLLQGKRLKDLP